MVIKFKKGVSEETKTKIRNRLKHFKNDIEEAGRDKKTDTCGIDYDAMIADYNTQVCGYTLAVFDAGLIDEKEVKNIHVEFNTLISAIQYDIE